MDISSSIYVSLASGRTCAKNHAFLIHNGITLYQYLFMKIIALINNILWVLGLIPTLMMAMMSPMMFDAPGSEKNTILWVLMCATFLLPVLILVTQIFAWIKFFSGNYTLSLKIALIPLIDVAFMIFCLIMIPGK